LGLQAGVHNLPFIPVLGFIPSDLMKVRRDLRVIPDPYTGREYVVVPPVIPDLAIIHAVRGSRDGGVITLASRNDRLLAMAAKKTIAVVEELVPPAAVLAGRQEIFVAAPHIDAVVPAPGGAHPTGCPGRYETDEAHLREYLAAARHEDDFRAYLENYVFAPANHEEYMRLVHSRRAGTT